MGILEVVVGIFSGGSKAVFFVTGFLANEEDATKKSKEECTNLPLPASKYFCLLMRLVVLLQTFL